MAQAKAKASTKAKAVEEEPAVPIVAVDPEAGEGDDEVQLVRTGFVRLRFSGHTLRLRRPFLGELKTLRLALEDVADAIGERAEDAQIAAIKMVETDTELTADKDMDPTERIKRRREIQRESRDAGRSLTAFSEDLRVSWWRQVAEMLAVGDPFPDDAELPSWIVDPALPNTILQHWRQVPLAPGR